MNLSEEGVKYPDKNYNPQTLCFNNFIEENNFDKPIKDVIGQDFVVYFTIFRKKNVNYLNIVLNGSPVFDTNAAIENITLNFKYSVGFVDKEVCLKPYNSFLSPAGYNVAEFHQYVNEFRLPDFSSFKVRNINLAYESKSKKTIYKSEIDYLVASFSNPPSIIFNFSNDRGEFLQNSNNHDFTIAYNFCKGPLTKYLGSIVSAGDKGVEILYLICYSENINIKANEKNFSGLIKTQTLEYVNSNIRKSVNISNNFISSESEQELEVYSGTIGLQGDILTPYSLIDILYSLNIDGKHNSDLLCDGFITNSIKKITLNVLDSRSKAKFGPYEYFASKQIQTIMLPYAEKPIQKYPDIDCCPQTLIFSSFSSIDFLNNEPLVDENRNTFSVIITIYKGTEHGNSFVPNDIKPYIGFTNMSASGKINLGPIRGLNFSLEKSDINPTITFDHLFDGKSFKPFKFSSIPILLSDGTILLDFFTKNMQMEMPFNNSANFSNFKLTLSISDKIYTFSPAINNLTALFDMNPIVFSNFTNSKMGVLVNNYGNPLTYAFNFVYDSNNTKYLVAYGELLSNSTLEKKFKQSLTELDNNNNIVYKESAYGIDFAPDPVKFDYNNTNTIAYFIAFDGIMIYPFDLFSLTIQSINIFLDNVPYVFTNSIQEQKLEGLKRPEPRVFPAYTPVRKRFYFISTNKEFKVQPPRPIDLVFRNSGNSIININIEIKSLPVLFNNIRVQSSNITINNVPVDLEFVVLLSGSTFQINCVFPPVELEDTIYFGLIELQGKTTLDSTYKTFGAFYDRKYVVDSS